MVVTIAKKEFLQLPETKPASEYIEILSPKQNANKVIGKILLSLQHGSQLGWFFDPNVLLHNIRNLTSNN
ncbi:Uma2 family endonuclease [Pseudanabaena sp. ABRG5-3]|uniref:Uma2 family endonuclease n=1 Tax=Pseudanabaena sp. ABRG5-3 TaxID=685565 RepID=UPI000DC6E256|nr:Uma2 family endonuclease [Pseudanabaena sp. ABRG5-3]BBC25877.1 hypothetical protein ABRG53_3620 [Pseudanabaena sp. ABRG5-3]